MATWAAPYHCSYCQRRAENKGQLRPIAILPYVYRGWMDVKNIKVRQWAMKLNDGRFTSPETL
eukprot:7499715-Heterocapsa_arctica.AAC.1